MGIKIALGGKGGVGKTTITALLARLLAAKSNGNVIAIDADPVTNLASGLGIDESEPITPIANLKDLIEERTGAKPGTVGSYFSLNPKVDDIPERFSKEKNGVKLLVMGTIEKGGSGCICPESSMLKALMNHLFLYQDDIVLMDMEAGVEHLGRATSSGVDWLIIVVNPGARSIAAAETIKKLGKDIGIKKIAVLANRVENEDDRKLIEESLKGFDIMGFIPETVEIRQADRKGQLPYEDLESAPKELCQVVERLLMKKNNPD